MVGEIEYKFDHYQYDQISFNVIVEAIIADDNIDESNFSATKNIEFTFKPVEPILEQTISWWVYLFSILIGLLILLCLIWFLAKVSGIIEFRFVL